MGKGLLMALSIRPIYANLPVRELIVVQLASFWWCSQTQKSGAPTEATQPAPEAQHKVARGQRSGAQPLAYVNSMAQHERALRTDSAWISGNAKTQRLNMASVISGDGCCRPFRARVLFCGLMQGLRAKRWPLATLCRASGAG